MFRTLSQKDICHTVRKLMQAGTTRRAGSLSCKESALHPVALKDFLTSLAKLRPILLKALLYGHVIAQLLSAKT
jgi:hypothetical protein